MSKIFEANSSFCVQYGKNSIFSVFFVASSEKIVHIGSKDWHCTVILSSLEIFLIFSNFLRF